ncbi:MAG TPA: hypothetical protein VMY88_01640 [Acidimicrobiales bacterium]|nr:hypothetical protein [Acidimicrobiales bacterium]
MTDDPGEWAPVVADRNAAGHRTALLIGTDDADDPSDLAEQMAEDIFRGAEWQLFVSP